MFRINRCVCMGRTFEELKELAAANGWDANELRKKTGCGGGCGLCVPYVRIMLRTGQTEFCELIREEVRTPLRGDGHRAGRTQVRSNEACAG
jgi:bacterioferritin-associated ferredoxin